MSGFASFLQSLGLLIARLGVGGILLLHGITHWTGANQGVAAMRDRYGEVGAPYADVAAWATIIFELVGGVFLIVGVLTRFVGVGLMVLSVLNISYFSYYAGPDLGVAVPHGGHPLVRAGPVGDPVQQQNAARAEPGDEQAETLQELGHGEAPP